jgi:hypothetical protein
VSIHPVPSLLLLGTGAVLLVVAGVLFARGVRQRRLAEGFRARAVETQAEVIGLEAKDVSRRTPATSCGCATRRRRPTRSRRRR